MSTSQNLPPKKKPAPKSVIPFRDAVDEMNWRHRELDEQLDGLLRKRGWHHTSNTPRCTWLWEKKLADGRTVLTNQCTAIEFEYSIELQGLTAAELEKLEREAV